MVGEVATPVHVIVLARISPDNTEQFALQLKNVLFSKLLFYYTIITYDDDVCFKAVNFAYYELRITELESIGYDQALLS